MNFSRRPEGEALAARPHDDVRRIRSSNSLSSPNGRAEEHRRHRHNRLNRVVEQNEKFVPFFKFQVHSELPFHWAYAPHFDNFFNPDTPPPPNKTVKSHRTAGKLEPGNGGTQRFRSQILIHAYASNATHSSRSRPRPGSERGQRGHVPPDIHGQRERKRKGREVAGWLC